jgi:hypothetical protein
MQNIFNMCVFEKSDQDRFIDYMNLFYEKCMVAKDFSSMRFGSISAQECASTIGVYNGDECVKIFL